MPGENFYTQLSDLWHVSTSDLPAIIDDTHQARTHLENAAAYVDAAFHGGLYSETGTAFTEVLKEFMLRLDDSAERILMGAAAVQNVVRDYAAADEANAAELGAVIPELNQGG